jgi:hypothetical protein
MGQTQKKQTGLSGDRHADFVGQLQSSGSFPIFFRDKDQDQGTQVSAFGIFQHTVVGNISADYTLPQGGERSPGNLLSATLDKPMKH